MKLWITFPQMGIFPSNSIMNYLNFFDEAFLASIPQNVLVAACGFILSRLLSNTF